MGYLLKEALKTLCGVNQWSYAVFWKIGCQNPKLLIWEECYYESIAYSGLPRILGIESPELPFDEWEACWVSSEARTSQLGVQSGDKVHLLMNKMMIDNHVNVVGEGLVGRAAFTGNHQWILSENYTKEAHPPEVLNEMCQQFSAGMQTVAVIPVLPYGVVQLGSSLAIMENMGFVNDVRTLVLQRGCVPGALLSDNYAMKETELKIGAPVCLGKQVSADSSGSSKVTNSTPFISDSRNEESNLSQAFVRVGQTSNSLIRQIQCSLQSNGSKFSNPKTTQNSINSHDDHCQAKVVTGMKLNRPSRSQLENGVTEAEVIPLNPEAWLNQQASLHIPSFGFDHQPGVDPLATNYGCLRLIEQQILSDSSDQGHVNNRNAPNGFMVSQPRTNIGSISSSDKVSVTTTFPEVSRLCSGMGGHHSSILNLSSLSNSMRPVKNNISCAQVSRSGLQNADSCKTELATSNLADHLITNNLLLGSSDCKHPSIDGRCTQMELAESNERMENDLFQALSIALSQPDEHKNFGEHIPHSLCDSHKHDYGDQNPRLKTVKYEDACVQLSSGDDLFDILGVDFKKKLLNGSWNSFLNNGPDSSTQKLDKINSTSVKLHDPGSDLYAVNEGNSDSGIFSVTSTDHLLDAVVSRVHSVANQSSDDNISCRTTLTKISSSSFPNAASSYGQISASDQMQGELFSLPKSLAKAAAVGSCSFRSGSCKEDAGSYSQTSPIYGSQMSSWVEQGHDMRHNSSVSTAYSKRPDEISKSNRKRSKPGENPRPRPKDRQMIQDRVKELREIVPNGAKCSIDALLERTIKHMLFLQSVTKHADKLKQTGECKIMSKEGGLVLKDNFEGGATWAYEVRSQSMVCPIIVGDLNPPRQMLVEMLCEERGLFLEIADIIRGLGLTILKGVMETRNDKIWVRFVVEANRDVTRMEIFISLIRFLEQTVKSSAASANGLDNDNMVFHQFHQAASIAATGRPCGLPEQPAISFLGLDVLRASTVYPCHD